MANGPGAPAPGAAALLEAAAMGLRWSGPPLHSLHLRVSRCTRGCAAIHQCANISSPDRHFSSIGRSAPAFRVIRGLKYSTLEKSSREDPERFPVPDELIDALLPLGEKATGPLADFYLRKLGEDRGADIAFILAYVARAVHPRVLELLALDRLEY